jgi:hypothetical protein
VRRYPFSIKSRVAVSIRASSRSRAGLRGILHLLYVK